MDDEVTEKVRQLIHLSSEQGFLTYKDVDKALPKIADAGLNGFQATFIRYVSGLITIAPVALWSFLQGSPLATSAWPLIIVRAGAGVSGVTCIIYATTHMVYADALAISFTDGAFIMVLAALILREKKKI